LWSVDVLNLVIIIGKKGDIMKKIALVATMLLSMFLASQTFAGDMVNINSATVEQL